MSNSKFLQRYESKSNLELLMIYKSDEFQQAAKQAAKDVLEKRLGGSFDLESAWQNEINQLAERSNRCHRCGADQIAYESEEFVFRRKGVEINWGESPVGLIAAAVVGFGLNGPAISFCDSPAWRLKLCSECYTGDQIRPDDYFDHPLFELYSLLGPHDVVQIE